MWLTTITPPSYSYVSFTFSCLCRKDFNAGSCFFFSFLFFAYLNGNIFIDGVLCLWSFMAETSWKQYLVWKLKSLLPAAFFNWLFLFPSDAISTSLFSLVPLGLREDTETQLIPRGQPLSDPDPPAGGHGRPAAVLCLCCRGPGCVRQVIDWEGAGVPVQSPVQGLHSVQDQPEWAWMVQIWTQPLAFKRSTLWSLFGSALSRWEEPYAQILLSISSWDSRAEFTFSFGLWTS